MKRLIFNSNNPLPGLGFQTMAIICILSSGDLKAINPEVSATTDTVIHTNLQFPLRGIFYYAWYPNNWAPNGYHVAYHPTYGYYDNNDRTLINNHINELEYGNIDVVIASWWGLDNANRVPRDSAIKNAWKKQIEERKMEKLTLSGPFIMSWKHFIMNQWIQSRQV